MRVKLGTLLVAIAVVMAQTPAAKKPVRRALVVTNAKYASLPGLAASAAEGNLVADALSQAGFEITRVTDFAQKDFFGNYEKSFLEKIQPGDTCFFYYSGYAVQVAGDDSYLLPVDFDPNSVSDMEIRAVRLHRLPEDFEDRKAELKIVVVEAPRKLDASIPGTTPGLMNPTLSDVTQTLFAFAAQTRKTTAPPPADGVGWFTRSLVKQIKTPGVRLKEVFDAVKNEVGSQTKGEQVPFINDDVFQEFFFHLPEKAPDPKPEEAKPPAVVTKNDGIQPGVPFQNRTDKQLYVWIPPRRFQMGCSSKDTKCEKDETPQHPVTITKGFWMAQTEVTVTAYIVKFLEANKKLKKPSAPLFNNGWKNGSQPVVNIAWDEAKQFCEWAGGRLPREAEWEYAARGGVEDEINALGDNAREKANFEGKGGSDIYDNIAPVGQFDANGFKLYDMLGNVWEWVSDFYSPTYYGDSRAGVTDPPGPDKGKDHAMRGGSWDSDPKSHLRLSIRRPGKAENNVGMRCVLEESADTRNLLSR